MITGRYIARRAGSRKRFDRPFEENKGRWEHGKKTERLEDAEDRW